MSGIVKRYDELLSKRVQIESLWRDVERWCVGFRGKYSDYTDPYTLYDNTIFRARDILVSGLYSYLTNPATKWFTLSPVALGNISKQEEDWATDATEKVLASFRGSNLYQRLYQSYSTLVNYGISLLYEEADESGLKFISFPAWSFVFNRDVWGNIVEVIVLLKMSVEEVIEKFGVKNVSDSVIQKSKNSPNEKIEILFSVSKNYSNGKTKPFKSQWVEKETEHILKEGGYDTFPFFVGQWQTPNDVPYGTSPAIDALPSVILANRITKTFWVNNEKLANPPLDVPYQGYMGDIDISPGALNYRADPNPQNHITPIMTTGNINIDIESLQSARQTINEKMFVDLFLMMKDTQMTATEVIQRNQEKMLLLGSVIGRLLHEVLTPLVYRTLMLLIDNGIIEQLETPVKVEFLSPLAQTQKSSEYSSLVVLLNTVLQSAQVNPDVIDNINWDNFIRKVADIYSVDSHLLNDENEVENMRQQREQSQIAQMQLQLEELKGKAMKNQAQAQLNIKKSEAIL